MKAYRFGHVLRMVGTFSQRNFSVCFLWVIDFFYDLKFDTLKADLNLEISDKQQYGAEVDNTCGGRADSKTAIIFTL